MSWQNQYKNSLKMTVTEEPADLVFYRPVGFLFAKSVLNTRITPNGVTSASMLMGIMAGILYAAGNVHTTFIAGILFLLANTLDCADGQLARMKGSSSHLGRIIDGLADYVTGFAVLVGMGIGYAGTFHSSLIGWILILAAGVSNTLQSVLVDSFRNRFIALTKGHSVNLKDEYREFEDSLSKDSLPRFDRAVILMYLGYLRLMMKVSPRETRLPAQEFREHLIARYRPLVRGWTLIGSSMRITIAVAASLVNRPEIYLLAVILPINLIALALYIWQSVLASQEKG